QRSGRAVGRSTTGPRAGLGDCGCRSTGTSFAAAILGTIATGRSGSAETDQRPAGRQGTAGRLEKLRTVLAHGDIERLVEPDGLDWRTAGEHGSRVDRR